MHRWPGRVSKQGEVATDGTVPVPVPDKAKGHLSDALNASCPVTRAVSSQHCIPFRLLCATVAAPFDYKRRPMAYWRRIRLFRTTHSPHLVRELKNSLKYTHQSRTRVLRILAARTWVNDPCASSWTCSPQNPTPADRRRDSSNPIGVVPTNIFGAPGRGRNCENLVY